MSLARCAPIPLSKVALIAPRREKPDREGDGSDGREIKEGRFVLIRAIRNERWSLEGWGIQKRARNEMGVGCQDPNNTPTPIVRHGQALLYCVSFTCCPLATKLVCWPADFTSQAKLQHSTKRNQREQFTCLVSVGEALMKCEWPARSPARLGWAWAAPSK